MIAKGGLAPRGLEALQGEYNGPSAPSGQATPPSGSDDEVADKRWWSSRSVSVNTASEATPNTAPVVPVENGNVSYHKAIQGLAISATETAPVPQPRSEARGNRNSETIKQYQAGKTDVLDVERQYLGAWVQTNA